MNDRLNDKLLPHRCRIATTVFAAALLTAACGGDERGDENLIGNETSLGGGRLQDPCVRSEMDFTDDLPDGARCSSFGYGSCRGMASDCIHYCAFDICQASECTSDADCRRYGAGIRCVDFIVDEIDFGRWCDPETAGRSTGGSDYSDCLSTCFAAGGSNCGELCK